MTRPAAPFRWDLLTPDQLGGMVGGGPPPDLWFLDDLVACAGKVLARGNNGDLFFVGRSLDSMFDLLGGALADTDWRHRVHRLPLSFTRGGRWIGGRWVPATLAGGTMARLRQMLGDAGLDPAALTSRDRPATFVDVVHTGSTFASLYDTLRTWVDRERRPWNAARGKLCFVGVTMRAKTSPNAFRWQQHAAWTQQLPARAVRNVSLHPYAWRYFGDHQVKLHRTYRPEHWTVDGDGPGRDERTRAALAEAVAIVQCGRSPDVRRALARAIDGEPALAQPWLRTLVTQLNR